MSKVFGTVNLTKDNEKVLENFKIHAIKNSNKIIYKENNIHVTILVCDNRIEMTRKHDEYFISMIFSKVENFDSYYFINNLDRKIDLQIETKKIDYNDKSINIEYLLSMDNELMGHFKFSLELEV